MNARTRAFDELADLDRQFAGLQARHQTALGAGDFAQLNQVQIELAELMERRDHLRAAVPPSETGVQQRAPLPSS
jgi:hypothetical protein